MTSNNNRYPFIDRIKPVTYPEPSLITDRRYRRRVVWFNKVKSILGDDLPLMPDCSKPITPEALNRYDLAIWRASNGNKDCRMWYRDWDFISLPGQDMLDNPHQARTVTLIMEVIDRNGLYKPPVKVAPTTVPAPPLPQSIAPTEPVVGVVSEITPGLSEQVVEDTRLQVIEDKMNEVMELLKEYRKGVNNVLEPKVIVVNDKEASTKMVEDMSWLDDISDEGEEARGPEGDPLTAEESEGLDHDNYNIFNLFAEMETVSDGRAGPRTGKTAAGVPRPWARGPRPLKGIEDARLIRATIKRLGDTEEVRQELATNFCITERHVRMVRDHKRWPEKNWPVKK